MLTAFAVVLVVTNQSLGVTQSKVYHDQARYALDTLAEQSERLYSQGNGARTTLLLRFPDTLNRTEVSGQDISFYLQVRNGEQQELYRRINVNVSGTLPSIPGRHQITLESTQTGVVFS